MGDTWRARRKVACKKQCDREKRRRRGRETMERIRARQAAPGYSTASFSLSRWTTDGWENGVAVEGSTCLLLAPSPGAIVTTRGNIGKSIWLPLPSSLSRAALARRRLSLPSDFLVPLSLHLSLGLSRFVHLCPSLSHSISSLLSLSLSLALDADG